MPKLSVCIPVEPGQPAPTYLVNRLLEAQEASIEVVVATGGEPEAAWRYLEARALSDPRLRLLPPAPAGLSAANLWIGTLRAATGDWISLIEPEDMIQPELPKLLGYLEGKYPEADTLGWNAFVIARDASRSTSMAVAVPVAHSVTEIEKPRMLDAFFQWSGSQNVPRMPFGLYHGAVRRSLLDTILSSTGQLSWLTPLPRWEWAARVLIFSQGLLLSNRPLSAVNATPFQPVPMPSALEGFPFDARIGLTATIAEIQARVLHELGAHWAGFNPDFVKACMIDCMREHDEPAFERKGQAYFEAIRRMPGGVALSEQFRPQYFPQPPADTRRGLHGQMLLVDRFIGNAATAQQFYEVVDAMLAPIFVITDLIALEDQFK
ncbi:MULTISPECIES: glycosyltransferase family 2 protein [Alphaproteobacteria]|uniref:Glycosyl transferase family 2 n=2 Tax=Alphaproteobacteria TaxID=28211 RepID=A0A512HDG3_9HYPH|nr:MULTISPECIES: glycosyltransferase [Alphaproteobacteria]GEO83492.1 hypothetical protein RNA01_04240 [Ciceribacter naphthalenivorans]GLR24357.1 hypothetical protein GCM10007920_41510 [Ciceribacter naphthalenivorans]GLT07213.1 hypothetical protein GCM10007926_41510 [Sphingomonas psychrolutea]